MPILKTITLINSSSKRLLSVTLLCIVGCNSHGFARRGVEDKWLYIDHKNVPVGIPLLEKLRFRKVSTNREEAVALLADRSLVEVNPNRVSKYVPQAWQSKPSMKFYLVRCVSLDNIGLDYIIGYDQAILWVGAVALTHRDAGKTIHTPLIVQLESPPQKVYVTISLAE